MKKNIKYKQKCLCCYFYINLAKLFATTGAQEVSSVTFFLTNLKVMSSLMTLSEGNVIFLTKSEGDMMSPLLT